VTGGGGVLCSRMAEALAAAGAAVAVADLREDAAEAAAAKIREAGGKAIGVACNVLDRNSVEAAAETVRAKPGVTDVLINGAGGNHPRGTTSLEFMSADDLAGAREGVTTFFDLDPKGIERVFNLNFLGTLIPSSMNAFRPLTKIPAYSAAKAAVSNFTQWLAVHMAHTGIRVNAVAPGFFLTDQNRSLLTTADGSLTPRGERIIGHTPLGRFGEPDDLLGVLLWLVSDASAFVTGVVIPIDGGFAAYSGV
jgi:NAD(P)-dependent dehydrogenase (short-subunit alcohol dehydrogenase family)